MNMIVAPIEDSTLKRHLASLPQDGITRFSMLGGAVRGALLSGTTMVAQGRANQGYGLIESLALGQALISAALLSTTIKDGQRLALRMDCTGALRGYSVETTWDGRVRGCLFCDAIYVDKPLESFDLKPFIGEGTLSVIHSSESGKTYTGQVALVHGRIAEDIVSYYFQSEQIRTALAASVRFDSSGQVAGAGGLFFQALPGAKDLDMEDTEDRLRELPALGSWFAEGKTGSEFLSQWFSAFEVNILAEGAVRFHCDCSKERYTAFLTALSKKDRDKLLETGPFPVEMICHNCGSRYYFEKEELTKLL